MSGEVMAPLEADVIRLAILALALATKVPAFAPYSCSKALDSHQM
jgi:hypothetical protein